MVDHKSYSDTLINLPICTDCRMTITMVVVVDDGLAGINTIIIVCTKRNRKRRLIRWFRSRDKFPATDYAVT